MNSGDIIMNILFPAECLACGAHLSKGTLCNECRMRITPFRTAFCGTCGAPLPGFRNVCHPRTPYLLGAAGNYGNKALRALVYSLKFERIKGAAEPLADILIHYFAQLPFDLHGFSVIPVPVSKERVRERGFNQAALIAERFANFFGMPIEKNALTRIAHRTAQSDIDDRDERHENIKGCYEARPSKNHNKIILIDDVTTSGATFTEAALTLRAAGAKKILALAVAKAL